MSTLPEGDDASPDHPSKREGSPAEPTPGAVGPFRDAFEAAFPPAEAAVHRLASRLYRALRKRVSRDEAAGVFAADHARAYAEGDFGDFRLPDLLVMAEQAGVMVEVTASRGTPAGAEATEQ